MSGQELHLTPIEYKLLCLLGKECGKGADAYVILRKNLG